MDRQYAKGGQLIKTKDWEYRYDQSGNLIRKRNQRGEVWRYEWNHTGMLAKVTRPDHRTVTFKYDALGRRIEKCFNNTTTKWVWDGNVPLHEWKEIHSEENVTKQPVITWVFEEGTFVPVAKLTETEKRSIATNYMGTPESMYDDTGEKVWSCELNSYGKVRNFEGEHKTDCPFRFQGQYEDGETGLYYNRFRYYDPSTGNYICQDPIELIGNNPTLYGYVKDPNSWLDPFGLDGLPIGVQVVKYVMTPKKNVLLGENMLKRVIPMANEHGYNVFKPRGKNPDNWMKNQQQWIRRQLNDQNVMILDYGPDPERAIRSEYYLEEMKYSKKYAGYERKCD